MDAGFVTSKKQQQQQQLHHSLWQSFSLGSTDPQKLFVIS